MSKVMPKYIVVRDTREKENKGWIFHEHTYLKRKPPLCAGMIIGTLKTGDYSLVGYEDILSIERKEDFSELWSNYLERERFEEEMERMSILKYKMVVIESCFSPELLELTPPQITTKMPGKVLIRWLMKISAKYNIPIVPAGQCGMKITQMFFEEVIRLEKDRWQ